jgi:hypothetical protein
LLQGGYYWLTWGYSPIAVTDHKSTSGVASWGAAPQGHASNFFILKPKYCNTDPSSAFVSLALPQKATEAHKLARGIVPLFPNQRQIAQCPKLVPAQQGVQLLNGTKIPIKILDEKLTRINRTVHIGILHIFKPVFNHVNG